MTYSLYLLLTLFLSLVILKACFKVFLTNHFHFHWFVGAIALSLGIVLRFYIVGFS